VKFSNTVQFKFKHILLSYKCTIRLETSYISTSAPYNNVIHINMKMTTSYIYNNIFDKQKWWEKGGKGD